MSGREATVLGTVLVAGRGEIACRVMRTCRDLGIATVAVHSDADTDALHARVADAAVRLAGDTPADTYLRADRIVSAALATGADAVHPGYGFLAEDADFARAVGNAGLVWIGPPPEAIAAMASKTRAKELMGVPLVTDPEALTEDDFPVVVKAAAGGGGRGMRVVREPAMLAAELASARAEARRAFGDGEVFVEPYVEGGRHVEVQLLADAHGTVWTLGTRDCSLQRRHQKVIEEAPAPGLPPGTVQRLTAAAERAARAIGYRGAGTVEFLVREGAGESAASVHFLEMNTRLQVEHAVTEAVYGIDLVAWQIRVAEGHPLHAAPPAARGHAVEARLYAEDPARGWAPSTGVVHRLALPGAAYGTAGTGPACSSGSASGADALGSGAGADPLGSEAGTGVAGAWADVRGRAGVEDRAGSPASATLRLDTGYEAGDRVGVHYDALLAKAIAWAPTRAEAVRRLAGALERARVHGPVTNRELLVRSLRHPEFTAARMDTGFYDRHLPGLTAPHPDPCAPVAAAVADALGRSRFGGFRNLPSQPQVKRYRAEPDGTVHEVRYRHTRDGLVPDAVAGTKEVRVVRAAPGQVVLDVDGIRRTFDVAVYGALVCVGNTHLTVLPRLPEPATEQRPPGSLLAPMPGTVVRLADGVTEGARVRAGQPLLWLEAMKMEHTVASPATGTLTALHTAPGRQVEPGTLLGVVTVNAPHDARSSTPPEPAAPPPPPVEEKP